MNRENCWVWFKGAHNESGSWRGGFSYKKDEHPGILIESPSYVPCRVPEWRIRTSEPKDKHKGPEISADSIWKIHTN